MKNYVDFKAFRKDLDKAMEEVAKKYGITLKSGNISYDENTFSVKVMAERADVDIQKAKFIENIKYMKFYGFTENDYKAKVRDAYKKHSTADFSEDIEIYEIYQRPFDDAPDVIEIFEQ